MDEIRDKNGKEIVLQNYEATDGVGVQVGATGHKLWVCIDGAAVLRVKAPTIELEDMRTEEGQEFTREEMRLILRLVRKEWREAKGDSLITKCRGIQGKVLRKFMKENAGVVER